MSKFIVNPYTMRVARQIQKKSIAHVAKHMNLGTETVTKYEHGEISISLKNFVRFAEAIQIRPESLFKMYLGVNYNAKLDIDKKILNIKKRKEVLNKYASMYIKGRAFAHILDDMISDDDILLGSNDKML